MAAAEKYDCIAIGSGEAGKLVPFILSGQYGKKCAIIERKWIGGSCPNIACLPSKNILHSADIAHETRMTHKHGMDVNDAKSLKSNMAVVKNRKVEMVKTLNGFLDLFEQFKVELIRGEGRFVGPKVVQVSDGRLLTADNIVICTGSRALVDAGIPGLVESKPMTHIEILDLDVLPSHLIIIGGGYVGVEFAQAYRRFGAEVTVIQSQEQILPKEDNDVVTCLAGILEKEGIRFLTNTTVESVSGLSGQSVTLKLKSTNGAALAETSVQGSHILVASGRLPNTEDLDLDKAGLKKTASGHVVVDEQLRTAVPGVYAAGDCAGSPYFTHMGFDDFRVILGSITGSPRPEGTRGRQVPSVLFTTPELAQVGLREKEANAKGIEYRLVKASMGSTFTRTHTLDPVATEGFAKALLAKDSDQILGFVALAPNAGEMLPVVSLTMKKGLGYQEIRDLILVHPTLNEGLPLFFLGIPPRE
jgi:pyruvate/2-oxoglutarate dehydrogenase complex dihydrolipoamide dehydrogenase (E3) component